LSLPYLYDIIFEIIKLLQIIRRFKKMFKLSQRSYDVQESPIRKLTPYADEAKKRGVKVYHLNIGQPDIETPETFWKSVRNYGEKVLKYGPSNGIPQYLEALKGYYNKFGFNLTTDDIFVTTAGSEAIIFSFLAVMNPGDEVIIPEPYYTNYNGFSVMTGVNIVPLTTKLEEGFKLPSIDKFEEKITARTKAVLLCNPGNPTGAVYTKKGLKRVVDLAKKHNLFDNLASSIRECLQKGMRGENFDAPKRGDRIYDNVQNIIVTDLKTSLEKGGEEAEYLGYKPYILNHNLTGDVREIEKTIVEVLRKNEIRRLPIKRPACILSCGRITNKVTSKKRNFNAEIALKFSLDLTGEKDLEFLSAVTNNKYAVSSMGGIIEDSTLQKGLAKGVNAQDYLRKNESVEFFQQTDGIIPTFRSNAITSDVQVLLLK